MTTARTRTLIFALTSLLPLAAQSALAAPSVCEGRFDLDGAALEVGAPVDPVRSFRVEQTSGPDDQGGFAVRLGTACASVVGVQVPRSDAFVVRSRFVGCGERPRFRLRLAFDADCSGVTGRVRSAGQLVAEFRARRAEVIQDPGFQDVDADAPAITGFAPASGLPGDTITVFGRNFDRDRLGNPQDVPAYVVRFRSIRSRFALIQAAFTVVSPEELSVVVPNDAASGEIFISERTPGGGARGTISHSPERFLVQGPFDPSPTTTTSTSTRPSTTTTSTTRHATTTTTSTTRHSTTTTSRPSTTTTTRPSTTTTTTLVASATVTFQSSNLSVFTPGTFSLITSGGSQQIGALFDANQNHIVDGFPGRPDLPYMRFPVPNASNTGFDLQFGSGYEQGADAVVGAVFGANRDAFFAIHFDVNGSVARPIFMSAGVLIGNGIIVSTDSFTEQNVQVVAPTSSSPRIIRGHVAGVATFLELDGTFWADGIVLDFVLPLPNDA